MRIFFFFFACLEYFVIVRARVARACPCVGADTDAVRLCPPCVESGIPAAAPDHSPSPSRPRTRLPRTVPAHVLYGTAVRCGCALPTAHLTKTPRPSERRLQRAGTARVSVG